MEDPQLTLSPPPFSVQAFEICGSYSNRKLPADLLNPKMKYMNYNVNLASYLTYWWINWIFSIGYKKAIDQEDLGDIPERHRAQHNHKKFKEAFQLETVGERLQWG